MVKFVIDEKLNNKHRKQAWQKSLFKTKPTVSKIAHDLKGLLAESERKNQILAYLSNLT